MREVPFGRPIIGEEEKQAVQAVLSGHLLVHGPKADQFEAAFADYTGGGAATSVASCTAGLHLAYFDLGIAPGDEVIVPAQTHIATAHAVELAGGKPVFVDAELNTGNIDIPAIEDQITMRTKAISIVHYLGMPVDMDKINAIAKKHSLFVVEDCALAIGTYFKGTHAGLLGDVGCFSFYPVKHMTTAEGGMVLSKHPELVARISKKKAFGVDRTHTERAVPGVYDTTQLGFNYRMSEIAAAIGIEQVKRLDHFLAVRERNYQVLAESLSGIPELSLFESSGGDFKSSYYCLSAMLAPELLEKRFEIVAFVKDRGVGTSVYYPKPVPHMKYYREKYGFAEDSFPNAARISYGSIALPVGPHLNADDMKYVAETLREAIASL